MKVTTETRDGVAILILSGKLVFDESLADLRDHVRRLLAAGIKGFVLDFSDVPSCDSSGCGEIIGAFASIRKAGGAAAFVKLSERVLVLWTRIRLTDIFSIFATLEEGEAFVRR